jgi:hypothetical protein
MSFSVSVIHAGDLDWCNREVERLLYAEYSTEDERLLALDKLQRECAKLDLFSEPFGGDYTVGKYWSGMAGKLGLPMLASLYEHGLKLETEGQMEELGHELDVLEAYWDSHIYELLDEPISGIHGQEREHLGEQMGYLREAIRIAKENGATLVIS